MASHRAVVRRSPKRIDATTSSCHPVPAAGRTLSDRRIRGTRGRYACVRQHSLVDRKDRLSVGGAWYCPLTVEVFPVRRAALQEERVEAAQERRVRNVRRTRSRISVVPEMLDLGPNTKARAREVVAVRARVTCADTCKVVVAGPHLPVVGVVEPQGLENRLRKCNVAAHVVANPLFDKQLGQRVEVNRRPILLTGCGPEPIRHLCGGHPRAAHDGVLPRRIGVRALDRRHRDRGHDQGKSKE